MAYNFKFPDVGEGITEGEVVKIRVKVGDIVKEDDIIAEVETDKAVVQIPSPVSGTILKINYQWFINPNFYKIFINRKVSVYYFIKSIFSIINKLNY